MQTDDRITEAGTEVDSNMQPIELPSASIEANPLLVAVNCQWCYKPITDINNTVNHKQLGIIHKECESDFDNDCKNAMCGFYS